MAFWRWGVRLGGGVRGQEAWKWCVRRGGGVYGYGAWRWGVGHGDRMCAWGVVGHGGVGWGGVGQGMTVGFGGMVVGACGFRAYRRCGIEMGWPGGIRID